MNKFKVTSYKKMYPYGSPSQLSTTCDVCAKWTEHGKMFKIELQNNPNAYSWVCSKRCTNMWIFQHI